MTRASTNVLSLDSYREATARISPLALLLCGGFILIASYRSTVSNQWWDETLRMFRWTDPFAVLGVAATIAVALQVAVHSLRLQWKESEREWSRVTLFVGLAAIFAVLVLTGGCCTALYEIFGRSQGAQIGDATTIMVISVGVSALCIDAARVVSRRHLELRRLEKRKAQDVRIARLQNASRTLPSDATVYVGASISALVLTIVPAAVVGHAQPTDWTEGYGMASTIALSAVLLAVFLLLAFPVSIMLITSTDTTKSFRLTPMLYATCILAACLLAGNNLKESTEAGENAAGWLLITQSVLATLVCALSIYRSTRKQGDRQFLAPPGVHTLFQLAAVSYLRSAKRRGDDKIEALDSRISAPARERASIFEGAIRSFRSRG